MNRRDLLKLTGLAAVGGTLAVPSTRAREGGEPGICFIDARTLGATGDGKTLDTPAINKEIEMCHLNGGGITYVSPGTYLCGTVVLRSNVTLYLEAGATILASKNPADFTPQSGPAADADANQRHLIFARDAENVSLIGPGRIDGQGRAYWVPSNREALPPEEGWRDVATFDWKPLDRPSPLLEFYNCKHLRIEDVRIENAPGWTLRPIQCDDVFIRGITIRNPVIGPNTDGIDLTCCQNVLISDCIVDTGDDAICLKSEAPYGGEPRVQKNITITNCVLSCCCNGFKFGTATHGGFENIVFTNSVIYNNDVPLGSRVISGIALEMVDGGWLEGVTISNIRMQRVRTPIFMRRGNRSGAVPGALRGVMIDNVHAVGAILTSSIIGIPGFNVEDVTLSNIHIESEEGGKAGWVDREIPERPKAYPEARMFGRLPAYGIYCRHAEGIRMNHIEFKASKGEERPAILCDDVRQVEINGLRSSSITGSQPVVSLIQSQDVLLHACQAPESIGAFLQIQGDRAERIALISNDLSLAGRSVQTGSGVRDGSVTLVGNILKT